MVMDDAPGSDEPGSDESGSDGRWSALLTGRILAVEEQRTALRAAIDQTREARRLMFADDEHDPDGSTASLDQARDAALLVRAEQTLVELAAAEERVAAGTYGRCERCGRPIADERLAARPETRVCVRCASSPAGNRRRRS